METNKMKRLEYLSKMIGKYKHCWKGEDSSQRLLGWLDEYRTISRENRELFLEFCEKHDFAPDHTAWDCLA